MTQTQIQELERLRNYHTRYELIVERGEERALVAYCGRHSRQGMFEAVRRRGPELVAFMGLSDADLLTFVKRGGAWVANIGPAENPWTIRFSGRTQREAIIAGELPGLRASTVAA